MRSLFSSKALSIFDPDHSEIEDRWITMGISEKGRLLIVIHTFREESKGAFTIRIISSRKASKQEIKTYGEIVKINLFPDSRLLFGI